MNKATSLYRNALVWDQVFPATEVCGSWDAHFRALDGMRRCGYGAVSVTAAYDPEDTQTALNRLSVWRRFLAQHADRYLLLEQAEDAERARRAGKLAVGFHFQGTTPFGRDLGLVEIFYRLGVRYALLAYNQRNHVGDGCHEPVQTGLSRFGRELVAEMQRVGMLVDCSHTGERTARDAFEMAAAPVIYSHVNAAAVHAHDRNIPDDLALACARTGGVLGVNGIGWFLGQGPDLAALLFRHVDHWVQLLGPNHVAIGLDAVTDPANTLAAVRRDPVKWPVDQGYQSASLPACGPDSLEALTGLMLDAGYAEADCRGILGENWLRLARDVWKPASLTAFPAS